MTKRIGLIFLFLFLICGIIQANKKIVILYTNDMMGRLKGEPAYFINKDFPPPLGNAASCATYIKEERSNGRKKGYTVLLLDAGNCFGNPALGELKIGKTVEFLNRMEYDACAIGIYDTRLGEDVLGNIIDKTSFPWLSANLISKTENKYIGELYKIFDCEEAKIGIFGLISEYGPIWVEKGINEQFFYEKEYERAEEMIISLQKDEGCDIIIGLTNTGFVHDSLLADSLTGIDIIIGGGEGRGMREPFEGTINHTIICRTYGNLSSIGRLEIEIDEKSKKIIGYKGDNITLFEEQFPPDLEILRLLSE